MKLPEIRESYFLNIVIVLFSLFVSWFCLVFGLAHLIEGRNTDIPNSEHTIGVLVCIGLCIIGVIFLVIAIAAIRGILHKLKSKKTSSNF